MTADSYGATDSGVIDGTDTTIAASRRPPTGRIRAAWSAVVGAVGVVMGIAPHVLHHIGLLAGTALVAGTGGTLVFAVIGLVASVPMLLRLRRRFASWWAPAIGLGVFVVMFSVSAFVIGPAISGGDSSAGGGQNNPVPAIDHSSHHTP
jgi:hypothetical protein